MSNMDQSVLYYQAQEPGLIDEQSKGPGPFDQLVHTETIPPEHFKEPPYKFDNAEAFGVNQRTGKRWSGKTVEVSGTTADEVLSGQKGRKGFLITVPTSSAAGIYIDSTESTLQASGGPLGFFVPIGATVSIPSEDSIYAISAVSGTATLICVIDIWG